MTENQSLAHTECTRVTHRAPEAQSILKLKLQSKIKSILFLAGVEKKASLCNPRAVFTASWTPNVRIFTYQFRCEASVERRSFWSTSCNQFLRSWELYRLYWPTLSEFCETFQIIQINYLNCLHSEMYYVQKCHSQNSEVPNSEC